jgi:hypothetical protein
VRFVENLLVFHRDWIDVILLYLTLWGSKGHPDLEVLPQLQRCMPPLVSLRAAEQAEQRASGALQQPTMKLTRWPSQHLPA